MKPTNKLMKRLFLYLFLIFFTFQTPSQADDIRDFQIEGMSIGDSLLDYFSEKQILDNKKDWYEDKSYAYTSFTKIKFLETYDKLGFFYEEGDKNYKILSISGIIFCLSNIEDCIKKQKEIDQELSELFKNAKKSKDTYRYPDNERGTGTNSKAFQIFYDFNSGDAIVIETRDWSEDSDFGDNLSVNIDTAVIQNWITKQ